MDNKIEVAAGHEQSLFQFCAQFCNELDKTKNIVSSPLTAAEILMALLDAGSFNSKSPVFFDQIQITDGGKIPSSYLLESAKLKSVSGVTLKRANKVFLNKFNYELNRRAKKTATEVFNVHVKTVDFQSDDAIKRINKWIENKTKKNIRGFFYSGFFGASTNIVLVSGVYFKGIWQMKFDPEDTEETIFHLNNKETLNVFLMYRKEKYRYKDSDYLNAQMVLLPFKNEDAHMLIVLPRGVNGLDGILEKLANGHDLMAEVAHMCQDKEVEVNIPRFRIETEIDFAKVFEKLGINTSFDRAVQKVFIEVTEKGTEPKPDRRRGGFIPRWKPKPIVFLADHPHLVVILCHNIPMIWVTFRGRFETDF